MLELAAALIAVCVMGGIVGAIVASIAIVLAEEEITQPIRLRLEKRYFKNPTSLNEKLAYFVGCRKCLSFWISTLFAVSVCLWFGTWMALPTLAIVVYGAALVWLRAIR